MGSRILIHNLGYPRVGALRQLKKSLEAYWRGKGTVEELQKTAAELRRAHWLQQREAGIDLIPCGDFSLYDHVLDTVAMLGAVPERFGWQGPRIDPSTYFAMARGKVGLPGESGAGHSQSHSPGVHAMEMTKWFDTNYHYIVPEFSENQKFTLSSTKVVDEFQEALAIGIKTKPVLLGPCTFLRLGKVHGKEFDRSRLLAGLIDVYIEVLRLLANAGAEWVQFDEPIFALDLSPSEHGDLLQTYASLAEAVPELKFIVANYFNEAIAELDADVISIESSRSEMELLEAFRTFKYPNEVGPGIYDIHSPRVPSVEEMSGLLDKALQVLPRQQLWVNPDCGLKTRGWPEVEESLANMVAAARAVRAEKPQSCGTQ